MADSRARRNIGKMTAWRDTIKLKFKRVVLCFFQIHDIRRMKNPLYIMMTPLIFGMMTIPFGQLNKQSYHITAERGDTSLLKIPTSGAVLTLSGLNFNLYNSQPKKFKGIFAKPPYKMMQVKYPASIAKNSISKGVEMLDEAIKSTPGQKIILAHSQGAQVCSRWMREHANDPAAPAPKDLIFILSGNPLRHSAGYIIGRKEVGGTTGLETPINTPWRIIDVARRYDGWADWVQDEENEPAVKNAEKGKNTLHLKYDEVDLFDTSHSIWVKGNTTFVLTREKELPLAKGKRLSAAEYDEMRAKIEAAYTNRP